MATKLKQYKGKKVRASESRGGSALKKTEIEEGKQASDKIAKRPTKDFSTAELSSLMQIPPGGAEPHQVKTQSRQFSRVANDLPEAGAIDVFLRTPDLYKEPMSTKTPKIDKED